MVVWPFSPFQVTTGLKKPVPVTVIGVSGLPAGALSGLRMIGESTPNKNSAEDKPPSPNELKTLTVANPAEVNRFAFMIAVSRVELWTVV